MSLPRDADEHPRLLLCRCSSDRLPTVAVRDAYLAPDSRANNHNNNNSPLHGEAQGPLPREPLLAQ